MLRRYWSGCLMVAMSAALAVGCRSVPSGGQPTARESAAALKREMMEERALSRTSEAHARYARGVIHEMNDEPEAANEDYYRAAMEDPGNDFLILEVSRRFLENKQPEKALDVVTRAAAQPNGSPSHPQVAGLARRLSEPVPALPPA
jgi:hypothetical protein